MFTVKDAHKMVAEAGLTVSIQTIYNWLKSGELPSVKVGGIRRIRKMDMEFFLAKITGSNQKLVSDGAK